MLRTVTESANLCKKLRGFFIILTIFQLTCMIILDHEFTVNIAVQLLKAVYGKVELIIFA